MRQRVRLGGVAVVAVLIAACGGGDSNPAAPRVDAVVGLYKLTTVNGTILPFSFPPDSFLDAGTGDTIVDVETWLRDDYDVKANGRVDNPFKVRLVETRSGGAAPLRDSITATLLGRWQRAGANLRFIYDSASVDGSRFALEAPDTQLVPLPTATGWSQDATFPRFSLGATNPLLLYTFSYVRQ